MYVAGGGQQDMIKYLEGLADAKHCHCSGSKRADMPDVDGRKP